MSKLQTWGWKPQTVILRAFSTRSSWSTGTFPKRTRVWTMNLMERGCVESDETNRSNGSEFFGVWRTRGGSEKARTDARARGIGVPPCAAHLRAFSTLWKMVTLRWKMFRTEHT